MKVKHVLMIAAVLLAMFVMPVFGAEQDSTVTYNAGAVEYVVLIPSAIDFVSGDNVSIDYAKLEESTTLNVTVKSTGDWYLKPENGASKQYKYNMSIGEPDSKVKVDDGGVVVSVKAGAENATVKDADSDDVKTRISFALEEKIKTAGTFTDTLTFTIDITGEAGVVDVEYITSAAQFKAFADAVNSGIDYSGKTIKLTEDIDLSDVTWVSIGTSNQKFSGTFDGNGKTISNLKIDSGSYVGLFGYVDKATIKNVHLINAQVSGDKRVGALIGQVSGDSIISDCSVDETSKITGSDSNTGGLIGEIVTGTVQVSCLINNADVENTASEDSRAAGIVGQVTTSAVVTVEDCVNNGDIKTNNGYAGGIVSAYQSGALTITDCTNNGELFGHYEGNMLGWYTDRRAITISSESNQFDINAIGCFDITLSSHVHLYGREFFVNKADVLSSNHEKKQKFSDLFDSDNIAAAPVETWDKLIAFVEFAEQSNPSFKEQADTYHELLDSTGGYSGPDWNQYLDGYNSQCSEDMKLQKDDFASSNWHQKMVYEVL